MKRVDLAGLVVEATTGAPIVVLREQDVPHRLLPIFVGSVEAAAIALAVNGEHPARPLTHDLMATLVQSLHGHLDSVEITELRDGSYLAVLAMHGPGGSQRLDTRPSDAIALAVRVGAPLFVSEAVLDEAGSLPAVELDEVMIDTEVDEFRSFLDEVDPSQFADADDSGRALRPGEGTNVEPLALKAAVVVTEHGEFDGLDDHADPGDEAEPGGADPGDQAEPGGAEPGDQAA